MAKIIRSTGKVEEVSPPNGISFSLSEMQEIVGGYIEVLSVSTDVVLILDEDGKFKKKAVNHKATLMMSGIIRHDDVIVGDVLLARRTEVS